MSVLVHEDGEIKLPDVLSCRETDLLVRGKHYYCGKEWHNSNVIYFNRPL